MDAASLAAVLCRDQAVKVWEKREEFDTMGIKLVCIVHKWIQREVGSRMLRPVDHMPRHLGISWHARRAVFRNGVEFALPP
jgi:hypothetical protein